MVTSEEQQQIEENLSVIRNYLECKFPGGEITGKSGRTCYAFIVMHGTPPRRYKLRVDCSRLSRREYTPKHTLFLLQSNYVASMMARAGPKYYTW